MAGVIRNYRFGVKGVDLVTDSLKLGNEPNDRATQLQNAEIVPDVGRGGTEVISKRGGLAALNSSAMTGTVTGIQSWDTQVTFTRTLYAPRQTEDANTFRKSVDGVTWTDTAVPSTCDPDATYTDKSMTRDARRIGTFRNFIVFPHTSSVNLFDGTTTVPLGTGTPAAVTCTDILVANGFIYFALNEPATSSPASEGGVYSLNLDTGSIRQVATYFGVVGDNKMPGGGPACLAWHQGQLWVGLNPNATTDAIGKVVRCYPEIDTTWTVDVSNLSGAPCSMRSFQGALYVGTMSSVSTAEKIYKRDPTAATYSAVFTGVGASANAHIAHLIEYSNSLYACQYHATAPTIHIKKSVDGTTWTTDRDVDSSDGGVTGNLPGGSCLGNNSDLFFVFRSLTAGGANGFVMRLASGTWTKVDTDNYLGPITILVERS